MPNQSLRKTLRLGICVLPPNNILNVRMMSGFALAAMGGSLPTLGKRMGAAQFLRTFTDTLVAPLVGFVISYEKAHRAKKKHEWGRSEQTLSFFTRFYPC